MYVELLDFRESQNKGTHVLVFVGLKNNPDLRVVLLFGYNSWKSGATRFLHQIVNPLNEKSIILAGGQVESFTSLISEK